LIHAANQTDGGSYATSSTKRALILHDSLTFLLLLLTTVALFGVTLFLFHSFNAHRAKLAKDWADQGRAALRAHKPADAVKALRASLSYASDNYSNQLLLAQALANAGETDQATSYYFDLKAARPGDGFINLQLARLERQKGNRPEATADYRAAIFGAWQGDGTARRREVRLELVDYLIQQKNQAAARSELLIAAGNSSDDVPLKLLFADRLRAAGDVDDAFHLYVQATGDDPHNSHAFEGAGRIAYESGDYVRAHSLLVSAVDNLRDGDPRREELTALAHDAARLEELSLSRELPARERAEHLLTAARIADARLKACSAEAGAANVQDLETRWHAVGEGAKREAMVEQADGQDTLTQLIFDTERETAQVCGKPAGDDALLLKLATQKTAVEGP